MTVVDLILAQPLLGKEDPKLSAMKAYKAFLDSVQSAIVGLIGSGQARDKGTAADIKRLVGKKSKSDLLNYVEGMGGRLNEMDSFVSIAATSSPMGLLESLSASGRDALDDLWILASAVADKGSDALKDDLTASLEAMTTPSDMFDEIYGFLEGGKYGGDGLLDAPSVSAGLEVVQGGQEKIAAGRRPATRSPTRWWPTPWGTCWDSRGVCGMPRRPTLELA